MILQIIVIVLLMFSAGATILVTTTEITSPTDRFNRYIQSITLHPDNPRLLIVTDEYAVHTFNPETKTKKLIAGSTTRGYVEGRGAVARFDNIYGVSYFNETTIIVTDDDNYCVRLVSLISQLTERYAGVCQSYGYSDGERLSAKFSDTGGMTRVGTSFYICDWFNHKIRQLTGNSVSTVVSGMNYPHAITSTQNKLYYSFRYGIGEFDLNSQTNKILTGGASSGFGDGSLSSAGFGRMLGITSLTEKILLAADWNNKAVRLVDLNKQTVSSITMPTSPWSLLPYNGNILVGLVHGRIVKFSLTQLPVTQTADVKCDTNKTLSIPTTDYTVRFEPRIIRSNEVECVRCPSSQDLSVGVHTFSYTYMKKLGQYVQKICEQQITVIAAYVMMLNCPDNMKLVLPDNSLTLNTTLPRPDITGTRLQCLNCPPNTQLLSEGVHELNFIFQDKLTKQNVNCSYQVEVKPALICDNETKHLYLRSDQSMTDQIKLGQCKLRLDTGVTEFEITDGCSHYTVHEWSPMERRAYLEAEYRFDCQSLSKLSYGVIETNAKQHTTYLKQLCTGCGVNVSSPDLSCFNDKLIITWKTSVTADQQVQSSDMIDKLEKTVRKFESKYPAIDLTVIHTTPRIASPVRQKSGLYLKVDIRTSCQKEGYIYNKNSDVCDKVSVGVAEVHCPTDMKLILPHNVHQLNITLPRPQIDDTRLSCVECPDSVQLHTGDHNITFSYMDKLYNVTIGCNYLITVIEQTAPTCHNETRRLYIPVNQKKTDQIKISENGILAEFDAGTHVFNIRDNCFITFIVYAPVDLKCPEDVSVYLPTNTKTINLTLHAPEVDDTRLSCVECPDSVQLDTGDHNVTFSYMDKAYNVTIDCSYLVTVIEQTAPTCHSFVVLLAVVVIVAVIMIVAVIYITRLKRNQKSNHSTQTESAAELGQPTLITQEQTVRVYDSLKMDNYENVKTYEQIQTQQNPCYEEILRTESKKEL